jgi:hypothetical protein
LYYRFIIKSIIPLSFILVIIWVKTPKITATPAKVKATGKPTISNNKVVPNMTKPII